MTPAPGEERLPRTDAEVAERDVAALQARLRAVEGERDEHKRAWLGGGAELVRWMERARKQDVALVHAEQRVAGLEAVIQEMLAFGVAPYVCARLEAALTPPPVAPAGEQE